MSLELKAPAPSAGLSWGFKTLDDSIALELKGKLKCSPLIGGDLKIDLLALANKIPVYGQLITALDIGTWVLERLSLGTLEIDYRIDLTFYANLALEEAFISYLNKADGRSEWDADLSVSGTFGGKLELSFSIRAKLGKIEKMPEFVFDAAVEGDCHFKIELSVTDNFEISTSFSGLIIKIQYKAGIKRGNRDVPEKSFNPLELIPSVTGEKQIIEMK